MRMIGGVYLWQNRAQSTKEWPHLLRQEEYVARFTHRPDRSGREI